MAASISIWKRVGSAFRTHSPFSPANGHNGGSHAVRLPDPIAAADNGGSPALDGADSVFPWVRRQKKLDQLQASYARVTDLMAALGEHFERQDERSAQIAESLSCVSRTLQDIADSQHAQNDSIGAIGNRIEDAGKHTGAVSAILAELPASLQSQAEAVRAVAQQMQGGHAATAHLVQSLQSFQRAVDSLQESGTAQIETFVRLHESESQRNEAFQKLVRQQTRRFLVTTIALAVLGFGALAGMGVVLQQLMSA